MTTMTTYAEGTFCWAELSSLDVERSKAFYRDTMGWQFQELPAAPGETYTQCLVKGQTVAALTPMPAEAKAARREPYWTNYVAVSDVDATLAKARELGAEITVPAMDVMTAGRMALFKDRQGAELGLWQAREHTGAQLLNEPGAMCWVELATRDSDPATDFYGALFGWTFRETNMTPRGYKEITCGGRPQGAILTMNEDWTADAPNQWNPYFLVEDCRTTTTKAMELGSRIFERPRGGGGTMFAIYIDPVRAPMRLISRAPRAKSA